MIILGTNSVKDTGYDVANSCRFQDSDSAEMSRAIASTGNNKTWTVSAWVKRVELGQSTPIFGTGDGGANNDARMVFFDADDKIECSYYNSGYTYEVTTNRLFRDVSAWYHICILFDTTESTAADRVKIYVNGTQETSFATSSYPSEDASFNFGNTSYTHYVNDMGGRNIRGSSYISELVYIDGTASAVTNFGEFDEDSPTIWKPKDVSGLSVGTNGVYLDFEDSANLGNAADGGTDFTEAGLDATDQATDTPTNNFCTMNPLMNYRAASAFSEGNCYLTMNATNHGVNYGTFALTAGKWYFEAKLITNTTNDYAQIGISDHEQVDSTSELGEDVHGYGYTAQDGKIRIAGTQTTYGNTFDDADIIGVILNLDDNEIKFSKNSTIQNSGTAQAITAVASTANGFYLPAIGDWDDGAQGAIWSANFGGCSAFSLSSAANDENGYGNFEYAPPSGFLAICTKNLAEYG